MTRVTVNVSHAKFVDNTRATGHESNLHDSAMIASIDYNYQNPSLFSFIIQIRAIVFETPLWILNLNNKRKRNEFWGL